MRSNAGTRPAVSSAAHIPAVTAPRMPPPSTARHTTCPSSRRSGRLPAAARSSSTRNTGSSVLDGGRRSGSRSERVGWRRSNEGLPIISVRPSNTSRRRVPSPNRDERVARRRRRRRSMRPPGCGRGAERLELGGASAGGGDSWAGAVLRRLAHRSPAASPGARNAASSTRDRTAADDRARRPVGGGDLRSADRRGGDDPGSGPGADRRRTGPGGRHRAARPGHDPPGLNVESGLNDGICVPLAAIIIHAGRDT